MRFGYVFVCVLFVLLDGVFARRSFKSGRRNFSLWNEKIGKTISFFHSLFLYIKRSFWRFFLLQQSEMSLKSSLCKKRLWNFLVQNFKLKELFGLVLKSGCLFLSISLSFSLSLFSSVSIFSFYRKIAFLGLEARVFRY